MPKCATADYAIRLVAGLWHRARNTRGNSVDIGRTKVRQRRKWFSRKYYASVMNIKEFYEDNIGRSFTGIFSDFARKVGNK